MLPAVSEISLCLLRGAVGGSCHRTKARPAVLAQKAAGKYLVQHSAGSGKTNSIAWTAHFLAELHDAQDRKVFDSVLVVSDRNVIDAQLQDSLFLANSPKGAAKVNREHDARTRVGYDSRLYDAHTIQSVLRSHE